MAIYRKVYYDKSTGQVILSQSYNQIGFVETTLIEDYHSIKELNRYYIDTIGMLELRNDDYDEDFLLCGNNIQVDLVTKEFIFNRPDDNHGILPTKKSLLEEMAELRAENKSLNSAIIELFDILIG